MQKPTIPAHLQGLIQTKDWPSNKAILLVHGIGNAKPGDYQELTQAVRDALGPSADDFAIYQLFYDPISDWFAEKSDLQEKLTQLLGFVRGKMDPSDLADSMVEVVGDVLWPVMSQSARLAIRELYLAQLKLMVLDGYRAGLRPATMELNIIGHSLGCFHTYEALHAAANAKSHRIQPGTHGVKFKNVILMASPVQLIRTVGRAMGPLVSKNWNATLADKGLEIPRQVLANRPNIPPVLSTKNFVSITGRLDPVGGHFIRTKADWAYMDIAGQNSIVDPQEFLNLGDDGDLAAVLRSALRERSAPDIGLNNPHSWTAYVRNHEGKLSEWLNA